MGEKPPKGTFALGLTWAVFRFPSRSITMMRSCRDFLEHRYACRGNPGGALSWPRAAGRLVGSTPRGVWLAAR